MLTIASKRGGFGMCLVLIFSALACGGRVIEDGDNGTDPRPDAPIEPVPTCIEICRRAVDICFAGAPIDQCVRDCETARTDFKDCDVLLDAFLRCRKTTSVSCTANEVRFEGCLDELNALARCKS